MNEKTQSVRLSKLFTLTVSSSWLWGCVMSECYTLAVAGCLSGGRLRVIEWWWCVQFGGINADCQVTESSMITTLRMYHAGLATVRVVNHTQNSTVTFYQRSVASSCSLLTAAVPHS